MPQYCYCHIAWDCLILPCSTTSTAMCFTFLNIKGKYWDQGPCFSCVSCAKWLFQVGKDLLRAGSLPMWRDSPTGTAYFLLFFEAPTREARKDSFIHQDEGTVSATSNPSFHACPCSPLLSALFHSAYKSLLLIPAGRTARRRALWHDAHYYATDTTLKGSSIYSTVNFPLLERIMQRKQDGSHLYITPRWLWASMWTELTQLLFLHCWRPLEVLPAPAPVVQLLFSPF